MSLVRRAPTERGSAPLHGIYPLGAKVLNTTVDVSTVRAMSAQMAASIVVPQGGQAGSRRGLYYFMGTSMAPSTVGRTDPQGKWSQPQLQCRAGEIVYMRREADAPHSKSALGGGATRREWFQGKHTTVSIPVLSSLAYWEAETGNEWENRQRIREQIDIAGIVGLPDSTADRNGNFTTMIDGLQTCLNSGRYPIFVGDIVEGYIPLASERRLGHGEKDSVNGDRPLIWFQSVDKSQRDLFNYSNFLGAMRNIERLLTTYLYTAATPIPAPGAAIAAAAPGAWPADAAQKEPTGMLAQETAMTQFWYNYLKAEAQRIRRMPVLAAALGANPARPANMPARGAIPAVAIPSVYQILIDMHELAYQYQAAGRDLFVRGIGPQLMAYRDITVDAERFVLGRALSPAAPGQEFDIIPRRQGR